MKICAAVACIFIAALAAAPSARCQISPPDQGKNEFGVWASFSTNAPHVIGITSHRNIGDLALRYGRTLIDGSSMSLEYTIDVLPLEMVLQPKITSIIFTNPPPITTFVPGPREVVYGGGINPLGLKMNFFRQHRLQLFIASEAGFVASIKPVPIDVPGGTQFNFTFDFQAGFQRFNSDRTRAWMFGYKLQHISNAYRHSLNPGLDGNVIFLGYSFLR